MEFRFVHSTNG